jgi:diguanylate cyclase (GGDEF)-like protein
VTGKPASKDRNERHLRVLTVGVVLATISVATMLVARATATPNLVVIAIFGSVLVLAENAAVVLPSTLRISPSVFLVLAAISAFGGRAATLGALAVGAVGPLVVSHLRHHRFAVVAFNCAQYALAAVAAAGVHEALRTAGSPAVVAVIASALTFASVNIALVTPAAIAESGAPIASLWADMVPTIPAFIAFGLLGALLGHLYVAQGAGAALGVLSVAVIARSVFGGLVRLREARVRLDAVHEFTAGLGPVDDEEAATVAVLQEARRRMRANVAELVVLPAGEAGGWRIRIGPSGEPERTRVTGPVRDVETATAGPTLVKSWTPELGDVVIAPISRDGVVGALLVGSHVAALGPFSADDLPAFGALANHAAITLANGRLLERLRWDARHDPVTELPNRTAFNALVDAAGAADQPSAVLLVDVDHFRDVNDTLGHDHGDQLLAAIGSRLVAEIGTEGTVARLGGDEFGILLPDATSSSAARVAVGILAALDEPFLVDSFPLEITASLGIASIPVHGCNASSLLRRADVALYEAKAQHSGWEVYRAEQDQSSRRRLSLAAELRRAIGEQQLEVFYQPVADLRSGTVTGMEALVRWPHPEHGMLLPDDFVPIAEHAGLIRPLTFYVLRDALRRCGQLRAEGFDLDVAVNLSVRSVLDVSLPDLVAAILDEHGLDARSLVLEITESSVMADPARSIGVLDRLSALGVGIAIDDFGTGYSSLSHLRRLPVDEVKIDRSFVSGMIANESDAVIVRSTIDLARNLGLRVVAEGVEDETTWDLLAGLGCDAAQGYYLSRPVPAHAFVGWLHQPEHTHLPPAS